MFFVNVKKDKDSLELGRDVLRYLKKKNLGFFIDKELSMNYAKRSLSSVEPDMVIVIGDDNMMLRVFREFGKREIPVLGIASSQSFLMQANSVNFKNCINLVWKNKYSVFRRSRLVASFNFRDTPLSLNDIGLFSSKSASLLKYSLNVNGGRLWKDSGDGVIVSTPTGSTGYSLSAGGPVVMDEPDIFAITPVSSLHRRSPVIVSNNSKIKVEDISGNKPTVVIDGDVRMPLKGDTFEVKKSRHFASFVKFSSEYSISEKLKKRVSVPETEKIRVLPPSAKLIYKILTYEDEMTQKDIISKSFLPERTVRHALIILLKEGLIKKRASLNDARQAVYGI